MTDVENTDLLLQYMRVVVRQQSGILEALNGMQRQNDNLSAILSQELTRRNTRGEHIRINRPRTRTVFSSTVFPQVGERRVHRMVTRRSGNPSINIPGRVPQSNVSNEILNATMNDSPVRVRPSFAQVRHATRTLLFRDISNTTQTICPIDRELLHADDTVLQIIHCSHFFRDTNLRRHFRGNTRCPLCRYDIREYIPTLETTFTFPDLFSHRRPTNPPPPPPSPFDDLEDPFAPLPSANIIPSQQTTREIQSLLGAVITNIFDTSNNISTNSL